MSDNKDALSLNREDVINLLGGGLRTQLKSKPEDAELRRLLNHIESKVDDDLVKAVDHSLFPERRTKALKTDGTTTYIPPGKVRLVTLPPPEGRVYATGTLISGKAKTAEEWDAITKKTQTPTSSTNPTTLAQATSLPSSSRPELEMGMEKSRYYQAQRPVAISGPPTVSAPGSSKPYAQQHQPPLQPQGRPGPTPPSQVQQAP